MTSDSASMQWRLIEGRATATPAKVGAGDTTLMMHTLPALTRRSMLSAVADSGPTT